MREKIELYTWVADPVPPDSFGTGYYIGADIVNNALGGRYGAPAFAEELAGSCGLSLGTVRERLEKLVLEGKVKVEEIELPDAARRSQIMLDHFTRALRALRRAAVAVRSAQKVHMEEHHGGDIGDAYDEEGWTCETCRDLSSYGDEAMALENILYEGEAEASSYFVGDVYSAPETREESR